jgi:hypothetical protein
MLDDRCGELSWTAAVSNVARVPGSAPRDGWWVG